MSKSDGESKPLGRGSACRRRQALPTKIRSSLGYSPESKEETASQKGEGPVSRSESYIGSEKGVSRRSSQLPHRRLAQGFVWRVSSTALCGQDRRRKRVTRSAPASSTCETAKRNGVARPPTLGWTYRPWYQCIVPHLTQGTCSSGA